MQTLKDSELRYRRLFEAAQGRVARHQDAPPDRRADVVEADFELVEGRCFVRHNPTIPILS